MTTSELHINRAIARCLLMGTGCVVTSFIVWKIVTTFIPHPPIEVVIASLFFITIMIMGTVIAVAYLYQQLNAKPLHQTSPSRRHPGDELWVNTLDLEHARGVGRN